MNESHQEKIKLLLSGIKINNYRSFKEFPKEGFLEIGNFNTIIGKNDVGKSNLLHAILLVLGKEKIRKEDFHKRKYNQDIVIKLRFSIRETSEAVKSLISLLQSYGIQVFNNSFCIGVRYSYESEKIRDNWFSCEYNESKESIKDLRKNTIIRIKEEILPRPLYISSFIDPNDELSLKQGSLLAELISPLIEESVLDIKEIGKSFQIKDLLKENIEKKTSEIADKLTTYLTEIWSEINTVKLVVSEIKLSKALQFEVKLEDKYVGSISLFNRGSGLQREFIVELLKVYRDLKVSKGHIFIIEEPEIFLHAGAQKRFLSILKDLSSEGQIIITTHSSIFIDRSNLKHTYLLKKHDGTTTLAWKNDNVNRLNEVVEELGINPSDILLANGVIVVEGPTDKEVLEIFARSVIKKWDEYNIAIIHAGGDNIKHYLNNPEVLKKLNNNIAIIIDADIKTEMDSLPMDKLHFKQEMENHNIPVFFWQRDGKYVRELENLFDVESINIFLDEIVHKSGRDCYSYRINADELNTKVKVMKLVNEKLRNCEIEIKKTIFDRKIARIMVKYNKIPYDIKLLLEEILRKFKILT